MDGRDHLAAGRGEHDRLNVVPAAGKGIHTVIFPHFVQQLVAGVTLGKIHQNGLGPSRYVPAAQATLEIPGAQGQALRIPDMFVCFFKTGVLLQGRAQQEVILAESFHGLQRLAADHGINAPHLVANFPAYFKQRDRGVIEIHRDSLWARPHIKRRVTGHCPPSVSKTAEGDSSRKGQLFQADVFFFAPPALAAGAALFFPAVSVAVVRGVFLVVFPASAAASSIAVRRISKSASTFI